MSIEGERIVIIGGSSGIGLAVAKMASSKGAAVVIAGRSRERLEKAMAEIGGNVEAYQLDVTNRDELESFFDRIGEFDHLTTPAADTSAGPFLELSIEEARRVFESKFWGQYIAARYAVPNIRQGGSIVLFAGIYAQRPPAGSLPIPAINGAIEALGRALAVELAPLRVNVVSPGLIDTPAYAGMPPEQREAIFKQAAESLPIGRVGRPEDIAHTVIYLMTNTFTTGSTLYPDGGYTLR